MIQLKPELESLVRTDVACGAYQSVDEFVERAVELLHEHETWLASNKDEIGAMIEADFAQAERGGLLDPEDALAMLRKRREARSIGW